MKFKIRGFLVSFNLYIVIVLVFIVLFLTLLFLIALFLIVIFFYSMDALVPG